MTVRVSPLPPSLDAPRSHPRSERLETARLVLRAPAAGDQAPVAAFLLSERAHFLGRAASRHAAWKDFAADVGHWALYGFGPWTVVLKETGAAVGVVGCRHPDGFPERELGWLVWGGAEGRGIAHEAALAVRAHDYRTHGTCTLVSYIDAANTRSIRLAERLGRTRDMAARGPHPDDIVMRHPGPEALA